MIYTRNLAADVIKCFEDLLDEHKIVIPDEDRTGDESEGCLYGMTYWNLVDEVENVLVDTFTKAKIKFISDELK